jgi:predicted transcriptional regulator
MTTIVDYEFWIPTIVSIVALIVSIIEAERRRKAEEETRKMVARIIDKLTSKLEKMLKKLQSGYTPSQQVLETKNRELDIEQEKLNWRKAKDVAKLLDRILKGLD